MSNSLVFSLVPVLFFLTGFVAHKVFSAEKVGLRHFVVVGFVFTASIAVTIWQMQILLYPMIWYFITVVGGFLLGWAVSWLHAKRGE